MVRRRGGDSEDEANRNAIKFCHETGSKAGCKVVVTYKQCGAFASDGHDAGWSKAPTRKEAEIGAIQACEKDGCKLVTSDCTEARGARGLLGRAAERPCSRFAATKSSRGVFAPPRQ